MYLQKFGCKGKGSCGSYSIIRRIADKTIFLLGCFGIWKSWLNILSSVSQVTQAPNSVSTVVIWFPAVRISDSWWIRHFPLKYQRDAPCGAVQSIGLHGWNKTGVINFWVFQLREGACEQINVIVRRCLCHERGDFPMRTLCIGWKTGVVIGTAEHLGQQDNIRTSLCCPLDILPGHAETLL